MFIDFLNNQVNTPDAKKNDLVIASIVMGQKAILIS